MGGGGGVLAYKKLMGTCRWMGSHFHDWIDHNGVAFSIVTGFWARNVFIFTVSKRTRMIVLQVKSTVFFIQFKKWVNSFYNDLFKGLIR